MSITKLAEQIKEIATEILELERTVILTQEDIADLRKEIEGEKLPIEKEILSNPEYKNESQRKLAIQERIQDNEEIRAYELEIFSKESFLKDTEFDIKKLKIEKSYQETLLRLEFLKLEKLAA